MRNLPAAAILFYLSGVILLLIVFGAIILGDLKQLIIVALAGVALAVAIRIFADWRSGFYIFLVWVLFEDLARKFMGNGTVFFFGKDVLFAVICLSFLLEQRHHPTKLFRPTFLLALSAFMLLAVAQVFNPNSPSIVYGLLGLKLYFFYVPLMFLGYALIRSSADLERFLVINLVLAAIIGGLGVAQAVLGPEFLNPAEVAPELTLEKLGRDSVISHQVILRPSSVFVSTGRFTSYMVLAFILAFGGTFYLFLRRSPWWRVGLAALSVITVAAVMGGSRGCFLWVGISVVVLSLATLRGTAWSSNRGVVMRRIIRRTVVVLGIGLFISATVFPDRLKAYFAVYSESLDPRNSQSDLLERLWGYPLGNLQGAFAGDHWVMGNGTGTASLGGQYVARLLNTERLNIGVEEGFGTLIVELGIVAPFLWLWWTFSAAGACIKTALRTRGSDFFPLAFALSWYVFVLLIPGTWGGMAQYQNFVCNAYLWLFIGVLSRLPSFVDLAVSPQSQPSRTRANLLHQSVGPRLSRSAAR